MQDKLEKAGVITDSLPSSPVKTTSLPSLDGIKDPEEKVRKLVRSRSYLMSSIFLKIEKMRYSHYCFVVFVV